MSDEKVAASPPPDRTALTREYVRVCQEHCAAEDRERDLSGQKNSLAKEIQKLPCPGCDQTNEKATLSWHVYAWMKPWVRKRGEALPESREKRLERLLRRAFALQQSSELPDNPPFEAWSREVREVLP